MFPPAFLLVTPRRLAQHFLARACGVWTYETRQGRKAATVVCFAIAAVTLAPLPMQNGKLKIKNAGCFSSPQFLPLHF
jgi:hypothetical protein